MGYSERKYVKRVQAMFTERQFELLREYAQEIDMPVGTLVRETVEKALITDLEQRRKQKALEWMAAPGFGPDLGRGRLAKAILSGKLGKRGCWHADAKPESERPAGRRRYFFSFDWTRLMPQKRTPSPMRNMAIPIGEPQPRTKNQSMSSSFSRPDCPAGHSPLPASPQLAGSGKCQATFCARDQEQRLEHNGK
jgi:hypothetical protein